MIVLRNRVVIFTPRNMIKITIAETQPVFAEGIVKMLSQISGLQLNQLTSSYNELVNTLNNYATDLLLLDAELNPSLTKETLIQRLKSQFPKLKIILFCNITSMGVVTKMRRAGLEALLSKNVNVEELLTAITTVLDGKAYLEKSLNIKLVGFFEECPKRKSTARTLTKREHEILRLIIEECSNKEIAQNLYISIPTVETHRRNLIDKLGVKNTAGLVREAIFGRLYTGFYGEMG